VASVFLDTSFLFAAFYPKDALHERALAASESVLLAGARLVTTQGVLVEFLTLARKLGPTMRIAAAEYVDALRFNDEILVQVDTAEIFEQSLELYRSRSDKTYSMVDCMAMVVCHKLNIHEVLTFDKDFVQEGFVALLRADA
jgi:predicted nucleic acid-binding protein